MGKSNINITLLNRKAIIVARPTIDNWHIVNPWYKIPLLCMFLKESRTTNAATPKDKAPAYIKS